MHKEIQGIKYGLKIAFTESQISQLPMKSANFSVEVIKGFEKHVKRQN